MRNPRRRLSLLLVLLAAGCSRLTSPSALLDGPWVLRELRPSSGLGPGGSVRGDEFTADFGADGRLSVRADCNGCGGPYEVGTGVLHVGPLACTRAYCVATAPRDALYVTLLQASESFVVQGTALTIHTEQGTLVFEQR